MPLYAQLEQALLAYIDSHGLKPGDRLPTEAEIAETYAVSRATIRQALTRLVTDGHVERVQGLGSFVAPPRPTHQPMLTSFTENMRAQGFRPQRRVLNSEIVPTPEEQRGIFGPDNRECQYIRRLLLADDRPVGISETWLPREALAGRSELFEPDKLESGSLYDLLQGPEIGLRFHRGTETIRASQASEAEALLLECTVNSPTLVVQRVTFTPSDRPIESTVMTFASSRYEYRVELFRPTG
jgi:GntR family transcriptional regulator